MRQQRARCRFSALVQTAPLRTTPARVLSLVKTDPFLASENHYLQMTALSVKLFSDPKLRHVLAAVRSKMCKELRDVRVNELLSTVHCTKHQLGLPRGLSSSM